MLGIDIKFDFVFKFVFAREQNPRPLETFLEAVLGFGPIEVVEILNPYNDKQSDSDKLSIVDLRARDRDGKIYVIEMQLVSSGELIPRVIYYESRTLAKQLAEGENYLELKPTISICIVNGVLFKGVEESHSCFELRERTRQTRLSDLVEIHFLELPKFVMSLGDCRDSLDEFLFLFKNSKLIDPDKDSSAFHSEGAKLVLKELQMLTHDEVLRQQYEDRFRESCDKTTREARWAETDRQLADTKREYREFVIEQIQTMQQKNQLPVVASETLEAMTTGQLKDYLRSISGKEVIE